MTPHPKSYRPDLPGTIYKKGADKARMSAMRAWARSIDPDAVPDLDISPRKLHPLSYRPDLSHWGYSFKQLTTLTQRERAILRTRPLTYTHTEEK